MSLDNYDKIGDDDITIYLPKNKIEVDENFITSKSNFEFNQNEINHLKEHFKKNYNNISNTFLLPIDSLYRILKKEEKGYYEYIEVC